jgi:pimeloyl-ACP methyl ester carboxylesterase
MWRAALPRLARRFRVIAPDLPGFGASSIPADGLDMSAAARRLNALMNELGIKRLRIAGHDIGLMVAYAYAAQFPTEVERLALLDAFLPGIGDWEAYYHDPRRWHFSFNGPTAEALVSGRERIYLDHFWNDFAHDARQSLSESERTRYAALYAQPGRMRAAWTYFAALPKTASEFASFSQERLGTPVLAVAGEYGAAKTLGPQCERIAQVAHVVVVAGSGHWLMAERPEQTLEALESFL